ncbi:hypothetical protein ACWNYO_00590 [Candidatus Vidania fulgoroideorum]
MNFFYYKRNSLHNNKINIRGSKSISNRIIFISCLLNKQITKINNISDSEDTNIIINFFIFFGINIYSKKNILYILGKNIVVFKKFFFKNAGTVVRPIYFLSHFITKKSFCIYGNKSMQRRSVYDLYKETINIGGKSFFKRKFGFLPIKVYNSYIYKKKINISCLKSSQYASSIIMGIVFFFKKNYFLVKNLSSYFYILLTLKIINLFGINVKIKKKKNDCKIFTKGKYRSCGDITVENDFSSLSYFFLQSFYRSKLYLFKSSTNTIYQGDEKIINCIKVLGFKVIKIEKNYFFFTVRKKVRNFVVNCIDIPDASMGLCLMIFIKRIKLFNIKSWNYKESNRIVSISNEIKKIGIRVKKGKNWIILKRFSIKNNFLLKTYNDHRILMCFFLIRNFFKCFIILNPNCVKKTFKNFLLKMLNI